MKSGLVPHGWIYRGQIKDWPLQTTIERALADWNIDPEEAFEIEFQTIKEFQRRILDPLYSRIRGDTLFCLSLMQHYGAPTRLLDCSYSPFAAAAFAMEKAPKSANKEPVVWCFSTEWLQNEAKEQTKHKKQFVQRNVDKERADDTFLVLYRVGLTARAERKEQFVKSENPLPLNECLTTQQGVFLCPADITRSFDTNLTSMMGWNLKDNVVKLRLEMDKREAIHFVRNLRSMNLSFASLFPGLEGFARSIGQQLFHFQDLARTGAGQEHYLLSNSSSRNSSRPRASSNRHAKKSR